MIAKPSLLLWFLCPFSVCFPSFFGRGPISHVLLPGGVGVVGQRLDDAIVGEGGDLFKPHQDHVLDLPAPPLVPNAKAWADPV